MKYCNKCKYNSCTCSNIVSSTTINSDQAGRDGLDSKEVLIRLGKLPANATDQQYENYIVEQAKGEPGDTYIPEETDNYFDL